MPRPSSSALTNKLNAYVKSVMSGKRIVGQMERQAVERWLDDLETGHKRGLHFDKEAAVKVCVFCEKYCTHSKGKWAGQPFILEGWQVFIIFQIFGWKLEDGNRRYRWAYIEMARKNGKSTLASAIALYLMLADGEMGAEVYSAATKKDQAKLVWEEAARMVRKSPHLRKFIEYRKATNNLNVPRTDSKFEPLGADANTLDGLNVHGAIIDELHAHKTREVWDVMDTATGSREQPLVLAITTAGKYIEGVCYQQHGYAEKVLNGTFNDDSYFAFICNPDEGDMWHDEKVWRKANPNLGVSLTIDYLRSKARKAVLVTSEENAFRMKHLSEWVEQATRWIPMDAWNANKAIPVIEELIGAVCYAGLDLSSTTDFTAFVLVFPVDDDSYITLPHFWIPEATIQKRIQTDRVPVEAWVKDGLVNATVGNVVDYREIRRVIRELGQVYKIAEIAFDRWNATEIIGNLGEDDGFEMVEFGQGYKDMSAPTKELLKLVLGKKLVHGGNPVMRWMASNVAVMIDGAENVKPVKDKSADRIDGIVASIMALDRAKKHRELKQSVYETRGFITL